MDKSKSLWGLVSRRTGDFCDDEAGICVAGEGVREEWSQDWAVFRDGFATHEL